MHDTAPIRQDLPPTPRAVRFFLPPVLPRKYRVRTGTEGILDQSPPTHTRDLS
jgi:hypothetical protein